LKKIHKDNNIEEFIDTDKFKRNTKADRKKSKAICLNTQEKKDEYYAEYLSYQAFKEQESQQDKINLGGDNYENNDQN